MSKYLESVCLWEQNEKYLFSFEGFYVKFAFKKGSPSGKGMLEMRSVCTAMERGTQGNCGVGGVPSAATGPTLTQSWREPAN